MGVVNFLLVAAAVTLHTVIIPVVQKGHSAVIVFLSANVARGIAGWKKHVSQSVMYHFCHILFTNSSFRMVSLVECDCGDMMGFCG